MLVSADLGSQRNFGQPADQGCQASLLPLWHQGQGSVPCAGGA